MHSISLSPLSAHNRIALPSSNYISLSRFKSVLCNCSLYGSLYRNLDLDTNSTKKPIFKTTGDHQELKHLIQKKDSDLNGAVEVQKATNENIEKRINSIRWMLSSMEGGRISISAYDTAWVALVEERGQATPQFPICLEWISDNQLEDGSWGASYIFSAYDRLINTLACVVALKKWNIHPQQSFIKENFCKLDNENSEHMTIGFEIAFPSLVELARNFDIELPDDSDFIMQDIYAKRMLKLTKIPKDNLYKEYTTLHFSLEGMEGLDWEKLLKLQCPDGSMLYSPASTAYMFMKTNDAKSLNYLSQLVEKFVGGVPYIYPVDMFARNWSIDRLQRLGISRYFQPEIKKCVDYVSRYWTDSGLYSISNAPFYNIDDTAMGFRTLRLHGHDVSADAFWNFKHGDAFCCFPRQSSESVTAMFNFYRASHLMFPGENVLEQGRKFTYNFLKRREVQGELVDKWVIEKDLAGEVKYALEMPWYASLPRVETRFYIDQYGGEDDVWIGKTLYKMPEVNNNTYLELAKLDYNMCQTQHQIEWETIVEWYESSKLAELGINEPSLLFSYFLAAASIFEPERSVERIAWAKSSILVQIVLLFKKNEATSNQKRKSFVREFSSSKHSINGYEIGERIIRTVIETLNQISVAAREAYHCRDIGYHLLQAWEDWLILWEKEESSNSQLSEAELLVRTLSLCGSVVKPEEILSNTEYNHLCELTNGICHQRCHFHNMKVHGKLAKGCTDTENMTTFEIETNMQKLVQQVLQTSKDGLNSAVKQIFLMVAKSFYYSAYCSPQLISHHINKVLVQLVI